MQGATWKLGVFVLAGFFGGAGIGRAAAGGQGLAGGTRITAAAQPIEATPASVAFENVPVGELYSQTVRISNLSNARLQITKIASSAGEFAISGVTLPVDLEANANLNFTVGYRPKAARSIGGYIFIATSVSPSPLQIDVKASAASKELGLSASETSVDFGVVAIGKRDTKELALENAGNTDITISQISVSGANFSVMGGGTVKLSPGQKTSVQLQFDPQSSGSTAGMVSIFSNAQDSPLQIPMSGSGAALSDHSVVLKWEESPTSVAGYYVYRSSERGGSYTKLQPSPVTSASYTDTGLAAGHTYFYRITAVGANNVESDESEQITVTVPEE